MSSNFNYPDPQRSIGAPDFLPKARIVSALVQGLISRVTTSEDHGYEDGLVVSLYIPASYGFEIDGAKGHITVVSSTEFDIPVDTSFYPAFTVPAYPPPFTSAQCVPASGLTSNEAQ